MYKVNQAITVRFLALGGQIGISDLEMVVTNPSGVDSLPITMSEISGNPGLYEASFIPDVIGTWFVRVASVTYPENVNSESYKVVNNLQEELIGELQSTPTEYSLLKRLKDLWDKLVELFNPTNGIAKIKIWDGTTTALISTTGRLKVENVPTVLGISETLAWVGTNAPLKANLWLPVLNWNVPVNYIYNPYQVQYSAGNSSSSICVTKRLLMASFNNTNQAFTDNGLYTIPDFASYLSIYFLSDVGTARTLTITYTNQDGVTGRIATYNLTTGSQGDKTGHLQRIILQSDDTGVRDITNISTNGTGTGLFQFFGETPVFIDSADASGIIYTDTLPLSAFLIPYGFTVSLQITSASTAPVDRMLNVYGLLSENL